MRSGDLLSMNTIGLRRPGIRSLRPLLLFLIVFSICTLTPGIAAEKHSPVVVVIANYLSLDDLSNAGPNARDLISHSAIALVNTGHQRGSALDARYIAMAAGVRAFGASESANFYRSDEVVQGRTAGEIYSGETGRTAGARSVVCLGLSRILRENQQPAFRMESIGLVGDAFHKAGLRTAAIGNSDTTDVPLRLAPLLAMDRNGLVDSGIVGQDCLRKDPLRLCGFTDAPDILAARTSEMLVDSSLVVVELGNFNRLEALRNDISDKVYEVQRRKYCTEILDQFLGRVLPIITRHDATLIVCSPCRAQSKGDWSNLSPMLMYRPGGRPGLLISATARTQGLLSNIDIAPTIISAAGLDVPEFTTGRPAMAVPVDAEEAITRLQRMERIAVRNNAVQIPALICVAVLVLFSATLSEIVLRRGGRAWMRRALRGAFLTAFALPGALLLVDGLEGKGTAAYLLNLVLGIAVVLAVSWAIAAIVTWLRHGRRTSLLGVVFTATAVLVAADVLTGARLLRWSIVSCDQIMGIRYYGIGNEYMGLLIGAVLLGPILFLRSSRFGSPKGPGTSTPLIVAPLVVWFSFIAFMIGYPKLGANVGGLLTAVPAFGMAVMAMIGIRPRARHIVALVVVSFVVIAGFAAVDILSPGIGGSHLGRSIALARIYGWDWLVYLVGGKILMHIGILKLPQTYLPILCSIPFFVMYGGRMRAEVGAAHENDVLYRIGLPAVLTGMVTAFLFNDSGVVPAAFIMATFVMTVQYLRLTEEE